MFPYSAQCLVLSVHALRPSRSLLTRFTHFLREGGRARPVRAWNVDIISRPLYLAVYCSVSLASEHTCADFWEMIPGIVSAFYAPWFGSGYTYGVSLRGYGQNFTRFLREGDDFMFVSVFSAELGSSSDTSDTCTASVHSAVLGFVVVAPVVVHDMWPDGPDDAELPGGAAGAVPTRLWTSLCSCSDKFPASPGTGFRSVHRQDRDGLKWAFSPHF